MLQAALGVNDHEYNGRHFGFAVCAGVTRDVTNADSTTTCRQGVYSDPLDTG
jgi:hypothetical protein